MKFFRFLTTLIIIHLINLNQTASSQEIAEFEIRRISPTLPFQIPSDTNLLDGNGFGLPVNQCNDYLEVCHPYQTRCGFSSSQDPQNTVAQMETEIDLSPLSFECFHSGCEFEYKTSSPLATKDPAVIDDAAKPAPAVQDKKSQISSDAFEQELEPVAELSKPSITKDEARQVMRDVFRKASSVREVIEEQLDPYEEYEFIPYLSPLVGEGTEPVIAKTSPFTISNARILASYWNEALTQHELVRSPNQWVSRRMLDLECQMCGSPIWNLYAGLNREIENASLRIERARQRKRVESQVEIMNGFAAVLRFAGDSLIRTADDIVHASNRQLELISENDRLDTP